MWGTDSNATNIIIKERGSYGVTVWSKSLTFSVANQSNRLVNWTSKTFCIAVIYDIVANNQPESKDQNHRLF